MSGDREEKGTEETPRGAFQDKVEFERSALSTSTGLGHRAMLQAYATQPHGQGHVVQYIEILTHRSVHLHFEKNMSEVLGIYFEAKFE